MEYLIQHKNVIEIFYLLSGPLMLIALFIGLVQLQIVRKDIAAKYKRECLNTTLSIFDKKIPKIIDLEKEYYEIALTEVQSNFTHKMRTFDFNELPKGDKWVTEFLESENTFNTAIDLLNEIELLARVILSGMADEDFAYKAENTFYIELIERFKPHITVLRDIDHPNLYDVTIELYDRWINRRKLDNVHKQFEQSVVQLNSVSPVKKIRGIGQ
jgi:hypothetical protein